MSRGDYGMCPYLLGFVDLLEGVGCVGCGGGGIDGGGGR